MAYRIAGIDLEVCTCNTPCPCAFGQAPTGDRCSALFLFDITEGNADGVGLAGTKAMLLATFAGPWTKGNWSAALILDANSTQQQRDALQSIFTGQMKGDAAQLAALIGDFKGVAVAPISYTYVGGKLSMKAGDLAEGSGEALKNLQGTAEIQVSNAHYPFSNLVAGKASKVMAKAQGLNWDTSGSGMWVTSFEFKG